MTRKDYNLLAEALASVRPGTTTLEAAESITQWNECVIAVSRALNSDNGRFDRERFIEACKTLLGGGK